MNGADIIGRPLHVNESCVMKNDCATVSGHVRWHCDVWTHYVRERIELQMDVFEVFLEIVVKEKGW